MAAAKKDTKRKNSVRETISKRAFGDAGKALRAARERLYAGQKRRMSVGFLDWIKQREAAAKKDTKRKNSASKAVSATKTVPVKVVNRKTGKTSAKKTE